MSEPVETSYLSLAVTNNGNKYFEKSVSFSISRQAETKQEKIQNIPGFISNNYVIFKIIKN